MSQIDDSRLPASPFPGFTYPNGEMEYPQHGFTRRERAAIDLCLPDSETPWLDDMIRKAQRQRLAAQALAGMLANPGGPIQANGMSGWSFCNCDIEDVVRLSLVVADAMLAARLTERK